ncbi:hypothetical protein [Amycolatopsis sp. H20-H5]|uniref:hypothetical protein n=1 Tax=Amycolatopsis sp. H20-H5 TaxID=3046309 RepID=UPI002DB9FA0F|nr:hypothetical protein [Amycolatopsis sp. H20-H5]MEC3977787.1 hypothetical protein [Amycolatopsis sp. H20-H5]
MGFPVGGSGTYAEIPAGLRKYHSGEDVDVVYDPADPTHARTVEEVNTDRFMTLFLIPLAPLATVTYFAGRSAAGWFRRHRAVPRTGWHPASALVRRMYWSSPLLVVTYPRAGEIALWGVPSAHRAPRYETDEPQRAWVGGPLRAAAK